MSVPVLNAGWMQLGIAFGVPHYKGFPPPLPTIGLGIVEGPAPMGMGWLKAKKAPTVLVDGHPGIQQGHDVGSGIPHVAFPFNGFMALNTLTSKHKVMIPVNSVLLQREPVGTYLWGHILGQVCAKPISLPMGGLVNLKCTVVTTATLADILRGVGYIFVDMAVDVLWKKLTGGFSPVKSWWDDSASIPSYLRDNAAAIFAAGQLDEMLKAILKANVFKPAVGGGLRGNPAVGPLKPFGPDPKW